MQLQSTARQSTRQSNSVQFAQLIDNAGFASIGRNPRVVPEQARQFSLLLNASAGLPLDCVLDGSVLPADLVDAPAGRRLQFLAGRFCAAQALRALGAPEWQQPLPRRVNGAPAWPSGVIGSITHTEGFVSAAVALATDFEAIGIDVERVISESRARTVSTVIAWPIEIAAARAAGLTRLEALTLVFSAKETMFKCLHPRAAQMFHFHDVRLVGVDAPARMFQARLVKPLSASFPAGMLLEGRFDIHDGCIHTGMTLLAPW